jgi:hypothetical protein
MTQVVINDYIDATLGVGRCCHGDLWPDRHLAGAARLRGGFFLVTEFPTPRKLGDRVAVVVIANAGHALIREQLVRSVLAAWMKRVPG